MPANGWIQNGIMNPVFRYKLLRRARIKEGSRPWNASHRYAAGRSGRSGNFRQSGTPRQRRIYIMTPVVCQRSSSRSCWPAGLPVFPGPAWPANRPPAGPVRWSRARGYRCRRYHALWWSRYAPNPGQSLDRPGGHSAFSAAQRESWGHRLLCPEHNLELLKAEGMGFHILLIISAFGNPHVSNRQLQGGIGIGQDRDPFISMYARPHSSGQDRYRTDLIPRSVNQ